MAKSKSKFIMVVMRSLVSGHKVVAIRPRNNDKLEMLRFDPYVRQFVVYDELKKVGSAKY